MVEGAEDAEGLAEWLSTLVLTEDQGLIPITHMVAHNRPQLQFRDQMPSSECQSHKVPA